MKFSHSFVLLHFHQCVVDCFKLCDRACGEHEISLSVCPQSVDKLFVLEYGKDTTHIPPQNTSVTHLLYRAPYKPVI